MMISANSPNDDHVIRFAWSDNRFGDDGINCFSELWSCGVVSSLSPTTLVTIKKMKKYNYVYKFVVFPPKFHLIKNIPL